MLLSPESTHDFRSGSGSAPARGWVAELSSYLRLADPELYQHSLRVARWSRRTALQLGLDGDRVRILNIASRFHDIGKVPFLHLVHKPGPLTLRERSSLDSHAALGARMLCELGEPFCEAAPLVEAHHVRYDMDGKPSLLGARVIAVADAYDAIVSQRPYHRPLHPSEALKEILRQAGRQFDPVIVAAFLDLPAFRVIVDDFTLGTLKATAERVIAKENRNGVGAGWVRRTFSDGAGELWEALEGEGRGVGVAPGFRRIVLRRLEDPNAAPVPGPITVAPLEVLPAEWLRGFVRLMHQRIEPAAAPAANGDGTPANENGAAHAHAETVAHGGHDAELAAAEDTSGARAGRTHDLLERLWASQEARAGGGGGGGDPGYDEEEAIADAIVAVDCAEVAEEDGEDAVEDGERSATRRHIFRGIALERMRPHRFRARVRIGVEGAEYEGEAIGADVPGARAEVAARAALDALQRAEGSTFELALQGARVVRAFDRRLVVVGVYALRGRDVTSLVGAALVRDSVEHAGALAALQATNRWVTWAASLGPDPATDAGPAPE